MWLYPDGDVLEIRGYDADVSFYSLHHLASATTCTTISNTGEGTSALEELLERRVRL